MYAILRGANGRRHEVDFGDNPVVVEVSMSNVTVQITTTAPGDPDRARFVTVTVPREQLVAAMAEAVNRRSKTGDVICIRVVGEGLRHPLICHSTNEINDLAKMLSH
jgi:hypothetical protein